MKKIFTFLFLAAFAWQASAAEIAGMLSFSFSNGSNIRIQVDQRYYQAYRSPFVIQSLSPGQHRVIVYEMDNRGGKIFGPYGKNERVLFNRNLNVRPGVQVQVNIDRYGRAEVYEFPVRTERGWGQERGYPSKDRGWNDDHGSRRGGYGDYGERNRDDYYFEQFKNNLAREHSQRERLKMSKRMIEHSRLSAFQVRQVMYYLNDDDDRFDWARCAYNNTIDPYNYYSLRNEFKTHRYQKEFDKFMRSQHR